MHMPLRSPILLPVVRHLHRTEAAVRLPVVRVDPEVEDAGRVPAGGREPDQGRARSGWDVGEGDNTITFRAGPAEGTITVEGSTNLAVKGKQLVYTDFLPTIDGLEKNLFKRWQGMD